MFVRNGFLIAISFIFLLSFVSAEFDLTITSSVAGAGGQSDLVIDTSSLASSGVDGFDLQVPSLPESSPSLISSVVGTSLVIDSSNVDARTLNLSYGPITSASTLVLDSAAFSSSYSVSLQSCGSDTTYTSCGASTTLLSGGDSLTYSLGVGDIVAGYRYFKMSVSLTSITVDVSDSGDSSGGGGGGGGEALLELIAPIVSSLNVNESAGVTEQIRFKYSGNVHHVSIQSIREGEADIVVQSVPQRATLLLGEKKNFDINEDGVDDVSIKLSSVDIDSQRIVLEIAPLKSNLDLSVDVSSLVFNTIIEKDYEKEVLITNNGAQDLELSIVIDGLEGSLKSNENKISLKSGESKNVMFEANTRRKSVLNGKILFKYGNQVALEIPVIINVRSANFLFDVVLNVPAGFKLISPGETLRTEVNLIEVENQIENVDVVATYVIKDYYGNEYLKDSETFAVSGSKSYVKEFDTSKLPNGKYVVGLEIVYPGAFAISSSEFEVGKNTINNTILFILVVVVILVSLVGLGVWNRNRTSVISSKVNRRKV